MSDQDKAIPERTRSVKRAEGEVVFAACPTRTRRYPKEKSRRRGFGKGMVNYGYSIVGDSKSNIISKNDTIDGDTPDEFSGIE